MTKADWSDVLCRWMRREHLLERVIIRILGNFNETEGSETQTLKLS